MSWDRVLPAVGLLALPSVAVLSLFGQSVVALAVVAAVALLAVVLLGKQRKRDADVDWSSMREVEGDRVGPERGSVGRALAVVEMRELLLSPWFAAGVGFCVVFGAIAAAGFENSWWLSFGLLPILVHPLCGMTIIATHRAVTRAKRDTTQELFASCPATDTQRMSAHLLTFPVPVGVALVFVAGTMGAAAIILEHIYGPIDLRVASDAVVAALLLPAGAVALGVLLGRRIPFAITPFIALALIALLNIEMAGRGLDGRGWLTTGIATGAVDFIYFQPPAVGRVVWIAGLSIVVAALALRTKGNNRATFAVTVGAVIALVGLVVTVQPLSDASAQRLAEYVIDPGDHETCNVLTEDVTVCALNPYSDHGAAMAEHVAPVANAIPGGVVDQPITMRLLAGQGIDQLPSQVQQRILPTPFPPGTVPLPFSHLDSGFLRARFTLASAAAGLPVNYEVTESLLVDGQARGVVVLWLATAGLPAHDARAVLTPDGYNDPSPTGQGSVWPGCIATVQWAPEDVAAARVLLTAEFEVVESVITDGWDRWTAAETSTDDLLSALGLPLVGPPSEIEPLDDACQ